MNIHQLLNSPSMEKQLNITADLISELSDHNFPDLSQEVWDAFSAWYGAMHCLAEAMQAPDAYNDEIQYYTDLVNTSSIALGRASIAVLDQAPQLYLQYQRGILVSTLKLFDE